MAIRASVHEFLRRCWHALHLKHHGRYSIERLVALAQYHQHASPVRKAAAIALTPLPALLAIIVTDIPKLAPPELGLRHSFVFWLRAAFTAALIISTLLQQLKCFLPRLQVTSHQVVAITITIVCIGVAYTITLATQIGFPVPFTLTISGPVSISCLAASVLVCWGKQVRADPQMQSQLVTYTIFITLQLTLTLVYPVFAFGYNQTDSAVGQTVLVCVLPILKFLMKAWLATAMSEIADLKPEFLIFNVEVFHAMFVACCMQNAKSSVTTAVIIGLDALHNWRTLREVSAIVGTLTRILRTKTASVHGHDLRVSEFDLVQSTLYLLRDHSVFNAFLTPMISRRQSHRALARITSKRTRITPSPQPETTRTAVELVSNAVSLRDAVANSPATIDAELRASLDALTPADKIAFVRHSLGLLHVTEFVVLAEYVEVIAPLVYATYLSVVSQLPNRKYYPQLRVMSESDVARAIQNVMVYAALELVSFIGLDLILRRQLKFPPIRHLAFVLDHHWWLLPSKLVLWVVFVAQCTLEHYGADYTFQFVWLKTHTQSGGG